MKEQFKEYLTKQGYSVTTPAGNPSTVYDYAKGYIHKGENRCKSIGNSSRSN